MGDPIFEALDNIFDDWRATGGAYPTPESFEADLAEYGFMIVPIEDPTNLRYGDE